MSNPKQLFPLIACLGVLLFLWAFASRIQNAETLTFRAYGLEIKAEGRLLSLPPTQARG